MSRKAKIAFLVAFLLLIVSVAVQFMTGMWMNLNSVLVGVAGVVVAMAVVFDWRLYWDFLTMRTTKHGMNMGALIVFVLVTLVCVNYLANRHNKTWDVTKEKLNSLSEQSEKVLKNLKYDLIVKVFYKGPSAAEDRQRIKQNLDAYQASSHHIKLEQINSYVDSAAAIKYLSDQPDKEVAPTIVFVERGERRIRVEAPYDEAQFTSAIIKLTREGDSKIYFITGHGEKDIELDSDQGLKEFAKALGESSFKIETLNLIDRKEIPKDTAVLAIVGPQVNFLDAELGWIRKYLEAGGKLFLAIDPGQRHSLANLTKTLGVQFQNNFVLSNVTIEGGGPATVLGRMFDSTSEVTKSFPSGRSLAIFPVVSEVIAAQDKPQDYQLREIVKSDASSFTVIDPTQKLSAPPKMQSITVGVEVKGPKTKAFEAVIFGDSDFISNRGLMFGVNRDLALNAIAQLANQKDLISIRPKVPEGNIVTLTGFHRLGIIVGGISLPLTLLILSGVLWFRRRGA